METCDAIKRQYDHKAERAKLTPEEYQETFMTMYRQFRQAYDAGVVDCAGKLIDEKTGETINCPERLMLIWVYRCWFCGKYFCPQCARKHFGDR